ncbi:MAG TPA: serine/threonine-protein kinase [Gemmatimonadaceae bacterium]|nr:serine/threonine-protein kinase [Gemmatimonadaceae bacterium]
MLESHQTGSEASTSKAQRRATRVQRLADALPERYLFRREIGEGGAAHVLLAHDTERNQLVAVKILRPEVTTAIGIKRFRREIEIIRTLQHPNVLPMLDSGTVAGQVFFTAPFVEGDTLETRIKREGQLTLADTIAIASDVAAALDYAHARGLIHRDVKPANILLGSGHAVVADFGIARPVAVKSDEAITISGVSLGTAQYMSPEQCGAVRELDSRTDVYAFGCVVYEMLTGDAPFNGPSEQSILARHCNEPPKSMRIVRPTLPQRVDAVVMKSLAKVRAHRYRSAGEFFDALDSASRS